SLRTSAGPFTQGAIIVLREWDPTTLAPDPTALALRRVIFEPTSYSHWPRGGVPRRAFVPPAATARIAGAAPPPTPPTPIQPEGAVSYPDPFLAYFAPNGPSTVPTAVLVDTAGARSPLPGPHPVLAHAVCDGGEGASLRVAQAVSRADVKPFPSPREFAQ